MNDTRTRTTIETDARGPLRDRRHSAAVVAEYIHEVSERHAPRAAAESGDRPGSPGQQDEPAQPQQAA
jgi:hypothetical protein